jgi:hypothetical protein
MQNEKLRAAAITAVAEYVGVAAEFIVDDAIDDVSKSPAFAGKPELETLYFFVCLGKHLPREVPYAIVKTAISKALGVKA